ncbi:MAG: methyltransferase domain-containing protein [Pseudomonadales bacterium]|nr:methyltransferase domain-containing protein [Pseudomonadales bacterium]
MKPKPLFQFLETANERPAPFSVYSARELWTEEHTSSQMLAYHLNEEVDLSSRRADFIEDSVRWMTERFNLSSGSRIIDFGCGPGLYTSRFARLNADVAGIDFSSRSIEYARELAQKNELDITYFEADYLDFEPEGKFDLIIMIMCDFCVLSPDQRPRMLSKFKRLLADGGHIVLDVHSLGAFSTKSEAAFYEKNQLDGFWSAEPYYAFVTSFKYETEKVSLDKYTIIEEDRKREIYNWLQYFTPDMLEKEVVSAGLNIEEICGDVAGGSYSDDLAEFAAIIGDSGDSE